MRLTKFMRAKIFAAAGEKGLSGPIVVTPGTDGPSVATGHAYLDLASGNRLVTGDLYCPSCGKRINHLATRFAIVSYAWVREHLSHLC